MSTSTRRGLLARLTPETPFFKALAAITIVLGLVTGSITILTAVGAIREHFEAAPIEAFLTDDPNIPPELESTEHSLLGLSNGMSIEAIEDHFGEDVVVTNSPDYGNDGWRVTEFEGHGVLVAIEVEVSTGATVVAGVSLSSYGFDKHKESLRANQVFASLPGGLLLGHSTAKDVLDKFPSAEIYAYWMDGVRDTTFVIYMQQWGGDTPIRYSVDHGHESSAGSTIEPWESSSGETYLGHEGCRDVITAFWIKDIPNGTTDYSSISGGKCS